MTFVGKVLVVVQVVLSVCFMAFAAAVFTSHTNWKTKHEELSKQMDKQKTQLTTELEEVKTANDLLVKSENDAKTEIGKLQAQVAGLSTEKDSLASQLKVEKDSNIKEQALSSRSGIEADVRKEEAGAQRTRNKALLDSRGVLVAEVQKMEDERFSRIAELKKLIEKHNLLLEENATLSTIISTAGLSTDPRDYLDKKPPPPTVDGVVLTTEREKRSGAELIEISLGSDDGLLEGHGLHVSRGKKYLGKISIIYVEADKSVGMLVKPTRNGSIKRGDNVTTKL